MKKKLMTVFCSIALLYYPDVNKINIMKYHMIRAITFLILINFLSSCKKNIATGSNTFRCKVNGKLFIPSGNSSGRGPVQGGFYRDVDGNRGLYIIAQSSGYSPYISLYIKKLTTTGIYDLNINTTPMPIAVRSENYGNYSVKNNNNYYSNFVTNATYTGWINVETIYDGGIVAGTFEFTGFNYQTGETLKITKGRFDVKN